MLQIENESSDEPRYEVLSVESQSDIDRRSMGMSLSLTSSQSLSEPVTTPDDADEDSGNLHYNVNRSSFSIIPHKIISNVLNFIILIIIIIVKNYYYYFIIIIIIIIIIKQCISHIYVKDYICIRNICMTKRLVAHCQWLISDQKHISYQFQCAHWAASHSSLCCVTSVVCKSLKELPVVGSKFPLNFCTTLNDMSWLAFIMGSVCYYKAYILDVF